jgi:integrase/recombinase XerD
VDVVTAFLLTRRHGLRNQTMFLLSVRAGLRAKEIANLKWVMVLGADGSVGDAIHLTDDASKGKSGRIVPLNKQLRANLVKLLEVPLCQGSCPLLYFSSISQVGGIGR